MQHGSIVALAAAVALGACGGGGGGGAGGGGDGGGGGNHDGPGACTLTASCAVADKACIGLVDNSSATSLGLRMSQIVPSKPSALATGVVGTTVENSVLPQDAPCNLTGTATWSWLLAFDVPNGTIETGGAKFQNDPGATGYTFDTETIQGFDVMPATVSATVAKGAAFDTGTDGFDLAMPLYTDTTVTNVILLPLHAVRLRGTLSASGDCIGSYNADGLDPANSCEPDNTHPAFLAGGDGAAFITLEEADTVTIASVNESLCVLLSGNPGTFGDGGSPVKCKRDTGTIAFPGDWCSSTNSAGGCADAVQVAFQYAASSVAIH